MCGSNVCFWIARFTLSNTCTGGQGVSCTLPHIPALKLSWICTFSMQSREKKGKIILQSRKKWGKRGKQISPVERKRAVAFQPRRRDASRRVISALVPLFPPSSVVRVVQDLKDTHNILSDSQVRGAFVRPRASHVPVTRQSNASHAPVTRQSRKKGFTPLHSTTRGWLRASEEGWVRTQNLWVPSKTPVMIPGLFWLFCLF